MSLTAQQHEEQLQILKQEFLQEIESELKKDICQEMRTRLEAMRMALKKDQYESLINLIYEEHKTENENRKVSSKRQSFQEIYSEKVRGLVESIYSIRTDATRPKEKYKSKDIFDDRVRELVDKFFPLTQSELIPHLVAANVQIDLLQQEVDELKAVSKFLMHHFNSDLSNRMAAVKNQKTGKDKVFSGNNRCMKECLDEVLSKSSPDKEISKRVYRQFCRLLKERYPTPPFRQKPRLSSEEKKQDLETQTADREVLQKYEWAETTLRNFFEKTLNVNIADLS